MRLEHASSVPCIHVAPDVRHASAPIAALSQAYQNRVVAKWKYKALLVAAAAAAATARGGLGKSGGAVGHVPITRTVCARRGWEGSHCGLGRQELIRTTYRRGWCNPLRARLRAAMTHDLSRGGVPV